MKRIDDIDRYLRTQLASHREPETVGSEPMTRAFVTISRQAGTGGHAFGETMLEVFERQPDSALFGGWELYDRELCEIVARDPRFASSLDSLLEEEYRSKTDDFFTQILRSTVDQGMVINRVFLVVRTIARMGKAIIVGRCGAQVTRDIPGGLTLRMVAPEDFRIRRAMDSLGITEREARAGARRRDHDRVRLTRAQFGVDIDDPTGYDMVCNVARVSYEEIAEAVAAVLSKRHVEAALP